MKKILHFIFFYSLIFVSVINKNQSKSKKSQSKTHLKYKKINP
jgi:preprotein translocase subunit SecG